MLTMVGTLVVKATSGHVCVRKARKEIYGCMKYQNQSVLDHYWETPHDVPMILWHIFKENFDAVYVW